MQVRELREIVGGRWAISWQLFWLNSPFSILSVPLAQFADDREAPLLLWTLTSALGYFAVAPLLFLADRTVFRNRSAKSVPISWVAVLGFVLGFVKSLLTTNLAAFLDPELMVPTIWLRATLTGLTIAVTLPIGAYIMYQFDMVRAAQFALLEERIRYSQMQLQEEELARQLRLTAVEAVSSDISDSMNAIRETVRLTQDWNLEARWTALSDTITEIAQSRIRPLSRELWEQGNPTPPSLKFTDLLKLAMVRYCMSPGFVSIIYGLSVFTWGARANGVPFQLVWTVGVSGVIFAVARPIRFIVRKYNSLALAIVLPSLVGAGLAALPTPFDVEPQRGSVLASIVVTAIWMVIVNGFGAFGAAALAGPSALLEQLESEVSDQRVRAWAAQRETSRVSRELAKHIHGRLQSRLMAASLAQGIEGASTIEQLEETLSSPLDEFLHAESASVEKVTDRVCQNWQGLLEVSRSIDHELSLNSSDSAFLGAVIEEALSNASRHGWADVASISLIRNGAFVHLEVIDNGVGPRIGEPGLGTKLYSSDPRAKWSLEARDGGGTVLHFQLPIE